MTTKVLLATGDQRTLERFTQVLAEAENVTLVGAVREADAIQDALARTPDVDVVVVDADIDGGRGATVVRAVGAANPLLGLVMLVDQAGPEQFAAAMDAGARSVISRTASLAEVAARLEAVASWVGSARAAVAADQQVGRGGKVIAFAGSKGGVGTSALALLTAQAIVGARTVGVVDLDLQSGDLAAYLGVHARRSVVDLVDIAGEMSGRVLRETTYDVPGGLRLLAAPNDGEREEEMTARAARAVVNALRFQYDVAVVDVGSHLSESTAAVLEDADVVVLVATPDLPSLRSARRVLAMWERLVVRQRTDVHVVLNRQSKRNEVTHQLAGRIIEAGIAATVPDGGSAFESAMNTASVVSASGPAHTAAAALGERLTAGLTQEQSVEQEVSEAMAEAATSRRRRARGDSGQAALEMPVAFGLALLVVLACVQGLVWGSSHLLARSAAYEGARTVGLLPWSVSTVDQARDDALDQLAGPWRSGARVDVRPDRVEVRVPSPAVLPGLGGDATVSVPVVTDR